MKVLIATDGSKASNRAVDYGVGLAARMGAEVLGVYVVSMKVLEVFALEHHDNIRGYEEENLQLQKEGDDALAYLKARCEKAGVPASTAIVRGYPAEEIVRLAGKEKVSLIIVGNVGRTGLEHVLMGSVSESVVRRAPCPVLVVRGEARL